MRVVLESLRTVGLGVTASCPMRRGRQDVGHLPVFPPLLCAIAVTRSSRLMTALLAASSHPARPLKPDAFPGPRSMPKTWASRIQEASDNWNNLGVLGPPPGLEPTGQVTCPHPFLQVPGGPLASPHFLQTPHLRTDPVTPQERGRLGCDQCQVQSQPRPQRVLSPPQLVPCRQGAPRLLRLSTLSVGFLSLGHRLAL